MSAPLQPTLIVVAGPNGAGKTTITRDLLWHQWMDDCVYINPDEIAEAEFGGWNDPAASLKAARAAALRREACFQQRQSFAFETVFSAPDKLDFVKRAKAAGYFVRLIFISTRHPSINAARITYRVMAGEHEVPIAKIVSRYPKAAVNAALALPLVDRGYVYDNSVDGEAPRLLFRTVEGKLEKQYAGDLGWAADLKSFL